MGIFALRYSAMMFQDRLTSLNAAISDCRSCQKKNAVHRLRSATRRVEAQLTLLEISQILSPDLEETREVRKRLTKVRRAAGTVRDLDVQVELIFQHERTMEKSHIVPHESQMGLAAVQLRERLQQRRECEALELTRILSKEGPKLALALENVQSKVGAIEKSTVPTKQLVTRIERWFYADATLGRRLLRARAKQNGRFEDMQALESVDADSFHKLRKLAKLCRYMAEGLQRRSLVAKHLATQFEAVQRAGGHWHDWLLLEKTAAKRLGRDDELTKGYAAHRDSALADYRLELANLVGGCPKSLRRDLKHLH